MSSRSTSRRCFAGISVAAFVLFIGAGSVWAAGKGPILIKTPTTFPFVINQPGSYQLTGNFNVPTSGTAISIQADNVTLDLNGFTVAGNGGAATGAPGIDTSNASARNITIKNGSVSRFTGKGINITGSGHLVIDIKADGNAGDGIFVNSGSVVERCTATANKGHGIETGKGCSVKDCVASTNSFSGIRVGQSCTVLQNTSTGNANHGIQADQGSTIVQNTCSENSVVGIEMGGRCLAQQNNCFFNQIGIEDSASGSQIKNNTCTLNSFGGIAVVSDCEISHNSCNRLNGIGIFCGGSNNSVVDNTCLQNTGAGINLGNGGNNYAATNKLSANSPDISNTGGDTLGTGDLANVSF